MFIGRGKEMAYLRSLYDSPRFECLILHGRRRVGKSFLLGEFASSHSESTIYFSADKGSEASNVARFSKELERVFHASFVKGFRIWNDVFSYLAEKEITKRLLIIFDEFTYPLSQDPAFDSKLQNAIDSVLKKKNVFLILCGSEVSVIEEIVDDSKKPLYGRKTADLKLEPFTYLEARSFFPSYSEEEALEAYMILGGTPLYLSLFDSRKSLRENVITHILSSSGYLFREVDTVLRMELNELHLYKAILAAVAAKQKNLNDIATEVGEPSSKIMKYLMVLRNLSFLDKEIPVGAKEDRRNALYSIEDNFFAFYFSFVFSKETLLNGWVSPARYYDSEVTKDRRMTYFGHRFEGVCRQYLQRKIFDGKIDIQPEYVGRWWGNNPLTRRQEDIDVAVLGTKDCLLGECKYRNEAFDKSEWDDLVSSGAVFPDRKKQYIAFSKGGFTATVAEEARKEKALLITVKDLFKK